MADPNPAQEAELKSLQEKLAKAGRITTNALQEFMTKQKEFHEEMGKIWRRMGGDLLDPKKELEREEYRKTLRSGLFSQLPAEKMAQLMRFAIPLGQLSHNEFNFELNPNSRPKMAQQIKDRVIDKTARGDQIKKSFSVKVLDPLDEAVTNYEAFKKFLDELSETNEVKKNPELAAFVNELIRLKAIIPVQHGPRYDLFLKTILDSVKNEIDVLDKLSDELDKLSNEQDKLLKLAISEEDKKKYTDQKKEYADQKEKYSAQKKETEEMRDSLHLMRVAISNKVRALGDKPVVAGSDARLSMEADTIINSFAAKLVIEYDAVKKIQYNPLSKQEHIAAMNKAVALSSVLRKLQRLNKIPDPIEKMHKFDEIAAECRNHPDINKKGTKSRLTFLASKGKSELDRFIEKFLQLSHDLVEKFKKVSPRKTR